mgnify:CR=1 FL=1
MTRFKKPVEFSFVSWHEEAFAISDLIRTKVNLLLAGIQHVRVVNILGLDLQVGGGTHVTSMCEVGRLRVVKYKSEGEINMRLEVMVEDV